MTSERIRTGGCLCGAVRYEVTGEPYQAGVCHCATCRKLTGSAFSVTADWRLDRFRMTGELKTFERRQFCPACGARLFYLYDEGVEIFLGTLDEAPNGIAPNVEIWTTRREHWLAPVAGVSQHEGSPGKS